MFFDAFALAAFRLWFIDARFCDKMPQLVNVYQVRPGFGGQIHKAAAEDLRPDDEARRPGPLNGGGHRLRPVFAIHSERLTPPNG